MSLVLNDALQLKRGALVLQTEATSLNAVIVHRHQTRASH